MGLESVGGMRLFTRIVEEGSFAGAARHFKLTPAAVSKRLSEFEESLGVRLFRRTTRKLNLTEAGEILYKKAVDIVSDVEQIKAELSVLSAGPNGQLNVTAPPAFGWRYVAPLMTQFMQEFPNVSVNLTLGDHQLDVVGQGYDVAIRKNRLQDSNLHAESLANAPSVVCVSPSYLRTHGEPRVITDLSKHNCLVHRSKPGRELWQFEIPGDEIESVEVGGNFCSNDVDALVAAAEAGLGVLCAPTWLVEDSFKHSRLVRILPACSAYSVDKSIYAMCSNQKIRSETVRVFVDFLKRNYERASWNEAEIPSYNSKVSASGGNKPQGLTAIG